MAENLEKFASYLLKPAGGKGEEVKFGSFWEDGPCIIFFLRRFGCQICRYQAKLLDSLSAEFKAKHQGQIIVIGPEILGAEQFIQAKLLDCEVCYDPEKKLFNDIGMKRAGVFGLIGGFFKKNAWESISKSKQHKIEGDMKGDLFQLGGLFGVEKGGKIVYQFKQNDFSEHADLAALAKAFDLTYVEPVGESPTCSTGTCGAAKEEPAKLVEQQPSENK